MYNNQIIILYILDFLAAFKLFVDRIFMFA